MAEITIKRPDDFHVHLRNGEMLPKVIGHSNVFGKVVAMGNLSPPIATDKDARQYRTAIMHHDPEFAPIMSIMLVNKTTPKIMIDAFRAGVKVLKLIPGGTSTGSDDGVSLENMEKYFPVLKVVEDLGMIFSVHWELLKSPWSGKPLPEEQREEAALPFFAKTRRAFPRLRIVAEHVSTSAMVNFVNQAPANVGATISAHHVGPYEFADVMKNGEVMNPLIYCRPVLKNRRDIEAVIKAMLSGNPKYFFGSDSAPHPLERKTMQSYAAGIFSPGAVSLPHIWNIFHEHGKTAADFENFVSRFGNRFYGLPENEGTITLVREDWMVPENYNGIVPYLAGKTMRWKIKS